MAKINTLNYQPLNVWDGDDDLFIVQQVDDTKVATPNQVKSFVLGTVDEVPTQDSNNLVKSGGIFSSMGVPCIDPDTGKMYLKGGAAFGGNIDSSPTAGSNNAVASGGTKTYVDNAVSKLNNVKNIDEDIQIYFLGYSDIANRVLCPINFPFAFSSDDYTLTCSKIELVGIGTFTSGISVGTKLRSSALMILSKTSSAGDTYCGVAYIHLSRSGN